MVRQGASSWPLRERRADGREDVTLADLPGDDEEPDDSKAGAGRVVIEQPTKRARAENVLRVPAALSCAAALLRWYMGVSGR